MHILTFDIEHWYESWRSRGMTGYDGFSGCDTGIVERLLDLLDASARKATFFFTGHFAREFPATVRACVERGHEAASHSDQHVFLPDFTSVDEITEDVRRSVDSIAQISGKPVQGFRAPKWSLTPALETGVLPALAGLGLTYDSSFFPSRQSNARCDVPHRLHLPGGGSIYEVPATAMRLGPAVLPAGGAYFRLFPFFVTRRIFTSCEKAGVPGVMYAHPYDCNPECHIVPGSGLFLTLMRTVGVKGALGKLEKLLREFSFTSMELWLHEHGCGLPEITMRQG